MFESSLKEIYSMLSSVRNLKSLEIITVDNLKLNFNTGESKSFFTSGKETAAYKVLEYIETI